MGHATSLIALVVATAPVHAAPDDPVPAFEPGRIALRGAVEIGETASLALDGWYAVNERFRLGLTMSDDARRELAAGRGLCLHACRAHFAGLAVETQVVLGPAVVGRAAIDTSRFAPTAAAVELGVDARISRSVFVLQASPVLRLGIARRDLPTVSAPAGSTANNTDTAAVLGQLGIQLWTTGGMLFAARTGLALDDVRATPSIGAAAGIWCELGPLVVTGRIGVMRERASNALFAELALAWAS